MVRVWRRDYTQREPHQIHHRPDLLPFSAQSRRAAVAWSKARHVHANYRFIVDPHGDYRAKSVDADIPPGLEQRHIRIQHHIPRFQLPMYVPISVHERHRIFFNGPSESSVIVPRSSQIVATGLAVGKESEESGGCLSLMVAFATDDRHRSFQLLPRSHD